MVLAAGTWSVGDWSGRGIGVTKMVPDAMRLGEVAEGLGGEGLGESRRWKTVILENGEGMGRRRDRTVPGVWQIFGKYLWDAYTGECVHSCMRVWEWGVQRGKASWGMS